jgi:hypothetical protein
MLAVPVYLAALAIPIYLLYRYHAQTWFWHILAIAAGLSLGFVSIPPELQRRGFDLLFGFLMVVLLFWGVGGLIIYRTHHPKHA